MASAMELLEMFANTFAKKVMDVFATKNDIPGVMKGAGSEADGEGGLVPIPHAGNERKYLRGDGTWQSPTETDNFHVATQERDGLLSADDKRKIDEITAADPTDIDRIIAGTFVEQVSTLKSEVEQ